MADVAGAEPAVGGVGLGRRSRVVPVAVEERRTLELDLAVLGDPEVDALGWPADGPLDVVVERRAGPGPGLGGPVALEDGDAEILPGLLEGRWQERPGRHDEPELPAELLVDAREEPPPCPCREGPGDPAEPVERRLPPSLL